MKPRTRLGFATVVLGCLALLVAVFLAPESVDFSLPPQEGLEVRYDHEVKTDWSEGAESGTVLLRCDIVHIVRQVNGVQLTEIERRCDAREASSGASTPYDTQEEPNILRASWTASGCSVRRKEGEAWVDASPDSWASDELRSPLVPTGEGTRRVGEEWSVDPRGVSAGLTPSYTHLDLPGSSEATVRLVTIKVDPAGRRGRFALLEVQLRTESTDQSACWRGEALYDLSKRIVVEYSGTGEGRVGERRGMISLAARATEFGGQAR